MMLRFAVLIGLLALCGCDSPPKTGDLSVAIADYNAQRYPQARERAMAIASSAQAGPQREPASYLAGLAAYQLGQLDEAERRLLVAVASSDAELSGKAKAMLGQVRLDQQRPREAAELFTDASKVLAGDDSRQSARYAVLAHQLAGGSAAAGDLREPAGAPPARISLTGKTGGFTLQVGAFQDKKRAMQAAEEAQPVVKSQGLGTVCFTPRRDERGKPLYIVQFGWFATRSEAAAVRARIGRLEYIVVPALPER